MAFASLFSGLLSKLFGRAPIAPTRVPGDVVIPMHKQDDQLVNKALTLDYSMKFDDVLDVDKLIGALKKLLEKPGWRKLGARVRLNSEGKLDYHVPAEYTQERPAINHTHVTLDMPYLEHPLGSLLVRPDGSFHISPGDLRPLRPLLLPENSPTELKDWLYTDRAQLCVHVVSFTDATIVTLTWLHTFFDAMSQTKVLSAWTAMLEGREEDVPEFFGEDFDPLATLGKPANPDSKEGEDVYEEEFVLKDNVLSGWKAIWFGINFMWDLFFHTKEETRRVIVPSASFKRIRAEALADLSSVHPATIVMDTSDRSNPKPFLSDGDVLCAWWTRLLISTQPWLPSAKPTKTVRIMNIFDMREVLANTNKKLLKKGTAFIGNCVTHMDSLFSLEEFLSLPLGVVAARIRSDLEAQKTRPQIDAKMRMNVESIEKTGYQALIGDADMVFTAFSNWSKGKLFETDFKGAVVKEGEGRHVVGRPTYCQLDGTAKGFSVRGSGACLGKDAEGNWWIGGVMRPEAWKNMEKAIEQLN